MIEWNVECDGGCPANPGPGAFAFVIKKDDGTKITRSGFLPRSTNNVSEYRAINAAALYLLSQGDDDLPDMVRFFSDSQLIVNQLNGNFAVRDEVLRPYYSEAYSALKHLAVRVPYSIQWFGREHNSEADEACNLVLEKHGVVFANKKRKK